MSNNPTLAESLANAIIRTIHTHRLSVNFAEQAKALELAHAAVDRGFGDTGCNTETRLCANWHKSDFWFEIAREASDNKAAYINLVHLLREDTVGHAPPLGGLYADLLKSAMLRINYARVADTLLGEAV